MSPPDINSVVAAALDGKRLLDHPFYRRWEAGEVTLGELADYASQYRHFESYLPRFLGELAESLPEGARAGPGGRQPCRRARRPRAPY